MIELVVWSVEYPIQSWCDVRNVYRLLISQTNTEQLTDQPHSCPERQRDWGQYTQPSEPPTMSEAPHLSVQ